MKRRVKKFFGPTFDPLILAGRSFEQGWPPKFVEVFNRFFVDEKLARAIKLGKSARLVLEII